jgi:glycosyl transferase, family 25
MNSIAEFSRIYVINLAHRADRRLEIAEQLRSVGLTLQSPNVRLFDAIKPTEKAGFESVGARGCFLSHLTILRESEGLENVLILEDDLNFVSQIEVRQNSVLPLIPVHWDIFYGGCNHDLVPKVEGLVQVSSTTTLSATHFVAFNKSVVKPMSVHLEAILGREPGHPDGGPMHVDGAYTRFRQDNPDTAVFVAVPELGYQRPSRTDIHALKWFDRTPVIKDAVQLMRRQRDEGRRRLS